MLHGCLVTETQFLPFASLEFLNLDRLAEFAGLLVTKESQLRKDVLDNPWHFYEVTFALLGRTFPDTIFSEIVHAVAAECGLTILALLRLVEHLLAQIAREVRESLLLHVVSVHHDGDVTRIHNLVAQRIF